MKFFAKLLLATFLASQISINPSLGAIAGSTCTTIGAKKKTTSNTYICTKVGKKKIWVKVVKRPAPTPSPTPTPTPTPSPTPTPTPTPSPSPSPTPTVKYLSAAEAKVNEPCLLENTYAFTLDGPVKCSKIWSIVAKEDDTVETRAYRFVLDEYNAQPEGALSIIWRIDPTTPEWKNKMQTGMIAGARLWGTSPAGSEPRYSFVSHDPDWLFDAFVKDGLIKSESRRATMFQGPCNAGLTGAETSNVSFWFYKFSQENCLNNAGFFQVPAHEYTHYAQEVLSKRGWNEVQRVPWLDEGLASFIGAALGPMSQMRNDIRALWINDLSRSTKDISFFANGVKEVYQDSRWGDVYPLGAIANEALVAAIGFKATKQIYVELATPKTTYDQAITKVTGVKIADWNVILQGYVDSVKENKAWSLEKLQSEYQAKKSK